MPNLYPSPGQSPRWALVRGSHAHGRRGPHRTALEGAVLLVCVVILLISLVGCGTADASAEPRDERPVVLTTFTVLADMARNVAGDHLRVESITKAGAEIHEYEVTPSDLRKADRARLILDNGLGLELWFAKFIDRIDAPHVVLSDGVDTIPIAEGSYQGRANPHAWMSPVAAQVYITNIENAFVALDPVHAADYRANAADYRQQVAALQTELVTEIAALPANQRALVTCEGAFPYLARDAGLTERYIYPVNGDAESTPQQVASLISFIRENQVPAVFCESTVNGNTQRRIAAESGAAFGGILYVDSLSEADGPVPTYLDLLRHDVDTIIAGLTGAGGTR